jgi:hypothetical protein
MDPIGTHRRIHGVRIFVLVVLVAAVAIPAASAKGTLTVRIASPHPRAGRPFTVDVRTGWTVPANDWLRLIAVAPGKDWYDVVGRVTGDSSLARARIPRDGFGIKLLREGPRNWRARVTLPRPGRWRLVVPNGTHEGFMVPPPAAWMPFVRVGP